MKLKIFSQYIMNKILQIKDLAREIIHDADIEVYSDNCREE